MVDDNPQAREILSDALRGFALRVESASSGEDALRALAGADAANPYSLVMMDWHMPGMDGLEASRIIKRGGRLEHVPRIVMVTAFGREDIRTEAEQIGVEGLPVKARQHVAAVRHPDGPLQRNGGERTRRRGTE